MFLIFLLKKKEYWLYMLCSQLRTILLKKPSVQTYLLGQGLGLFVGTVVLHVYSIHFILIKINSAHNRSQKNELLLFQYIPGLYLLCKANSSCSITSDLIHIREEHVVSRRMYAYEADKSLRTVTLSRLMLYNCLLFCR
jgi:hypothetical protein